MYNGKISEQNRKPPKGKASTFSNLPASQCGRAIAYNPDGGDIAVGANDGSVTVRNDIKEMEECEATMDDAEEWIECMAFSPNGEYLAVGSHDNNIYVYDADDYSLEFTLKAHTSFIVSLDWSEDNKFIRSVCGGHELLFFDIEKKEQDKNGASNTVDTVWATNSAKFGWCVDGIFPSGTDGTHINGVDFSKDGKLIATGDDFGLVNLYRNPCLNGHKGISLRGHSEHVVRVKFHDDDKYLFSVGGYDQTLIQWVKK